MPNDETKRTKSEPSVSGHKWVVRAFVVLAAITGLGLLYWQVSSDQQVIDLHHHRYRTQIMRTEAELEHGLSGSKSLGADRAMLFVFPYASTWGIWMKDMNYPIDIVWLNNDRTVIYSVKNATPASYPHSFKPDQPARYVIELPSGTIEKTGIVIGDPAGFPSGI